MPLPEPDATARLHSQRLYTHITNEIADAGGWISFAEYMQLALYAPGLGYYAAGAHKLGAAGDFITAPEISPLFAFALAEAISPVLRSTEGAVLELGPGSGRLAAHLLPLLAERDALPARYALLETSPDLRQRQQHTLAALPETLASRCLWLDTLPERFTGVVFGNEVIDALPVEVVRREGERLWRRGAGIQAGGRIGWADRELSEGELWRAARARLPEGNHIGEINVRAEALIASIGGILQAGMLLILDYGDPATQLYHPQRAGGTLRCFYRHRVHDDPFLWPGLQDITAHVDFTALALAGDEASLELAGFTSQAQFLINCGILDALQATGEPGSSTYLQAANALNRLLHPAEMGEMVKAIAWTKGIDRLPLGFQAGNKIHRL